MRYPMLEEWLNILMGFVATLLWFFISVMLYALIQVYATGMVYIIGTISLGTLLSFMLIMMWSTILGDLFD